MLGPKQFFRSFILILSVLILFSRSLLSQVEVAHVRQVDTVETSLDLFGESKPMQITLTFDLDWM